MTTLRDTYEIACPKCGNADDLHLLVEAVATLNVDGTIIEDAHPEWSDNHWCSCPDCGFEATVADFMIDDEESEAA